MYDPINQFFTQLAGKTVAFVGLGISHRETIQLFASKGISVIAVEQKSLSQLDPSLVAQLATQNIPLLTDLTDISTLEADILFRTPGMYYLSPQLTAFRKKGGIVTSEMEVFCQLCPCPLIAITGSDGKTTTSTLIAEMLTAAGKTVHLGGNIGRALLPLIDQIQPTDYAVVELSSFQLISMRPAPTISVVTNVMPNHLDIHADMAEYIAAKENIFAHQNAFSRTVLGADNSVTASFAPQVRGDLSTFSLTTPVDNGAYLKGDTLTLVRHGEEHPLFPASQIKIPGVHNIANYLTAIAAVDPLVTPQQMAQIAQTFGGVEHRIELVRVRNEVEWYNDSIASSPSRTISAIRAFSGRLLLIAGGYDKHIPYDPLAPEIVGHVKVLILLGATAPKIEAVVTAHPDYAVGHPLILHAKSLEQAIQLADQQATPGDAVALSPASASFDMFKDYIHRGRSFKDLVHQLDPPTPS